MLTKEQEETIKKQIISHIEESFPEDKKGFARKRIESMSSAELEEFLQKNNLMMNQSDSSEKGNPQCVFCSIVSGDIISSKISENKNAIAVIEINPVSKGHILIIPKEHAISHEKEQKKDIGNLVKNISKLLEKKFKPKSIIVSPSNLFGHEVINVIPQFNEETADSQRHKATPEEISEIHKILASKKDNTNEKAKKVEKIKTPKPKKIEEKFWLPRRIP